LKVTEKDSYDVMKKIEATFESYWNDREFKSFIASDPQCEEQLQQALQKKKEHYTSLLFQFDVMPYDFQKEILEKLEAQRTLYGRMRNLLVAATGVGKTVVSAFDYKRFKQGCRYP
jgi:superfamily II DNA or RNA helicase